MGQSLFVTLNSLTVILFKRHMSGKRTIQSTTLIAFQNLKHSVKDAKNMCTYLEKKFKNQDIENRRIFLSMSHLPSSP